MPASNLAFHEYLEKFKIQKIIIKGVLKLYREMNHFVELCGIF